MLAAGALTFALVVPSGGGAGAVAGPATGANSLTATPGDETTAQATTPPDAAGATTADQQAAAKQDAQDEQSKQVAPSTKVKIPQHGTGTFTRAKVDGPKVGAKSGRLLRYAVKVEKNLPYEADDIARAAQKTLSDPRSWIGSGDWRLELVSDPDRADFTIYLATPDTVDRYCYPLRTYGRVSCQAGNRVMLNAERWARGAEAFGDDVSGYRQYLVNHEVGHRLGHNHVGCPGKGKRAPVMMQQTKGVGACEANPWPSPKRTTIDAH